MHDLPYLQGKDMGPETVACMTRACLTAKEALQGHGHTTQDKTLVHIYAHKINNYMSKLLHV